MLSLRPFFFIPYRCYFESFLVSWLGGFFAKPGFLLLDSAVLQMCHQILSSDKHQNSKQNLREIANAYGIRHWIFRNIFSATKRKIELIKSMPELQLKDQLPLQKPVLNSVRKQQSPLQLPIQNYFQLL